MTVRVEKLQAPALPPLALAVLGFASNTMTALIFWWRRPVTLAMSDAWLSDCSRIESRRRPY